MNKSGYLKIGELSKQTGLSVGNLRYYSDLGLLQPVYRGDNGYRYYNPNASEQIEFIKKAQSLGFTLEEIKQILDIRDRGEVPCELVKSLLDSKIRELAVQIQRMNLFKAELEEYRAQWSSNTESKPILNQEVCPLISQVPLLK